MSATNFNPGSHSPGYCRHCTLFRTHGEILLKYPTREGWAYARDWACLTCGMTKDNGLLPREASPSFLLPAMGTHWKQAVNLPFGNK